MSPIVRWHETDMATAFRNVRSQGQSGKHLLALSFSDCVQVFGRRHDELFHALWRPASKKRQGTKSREVWH
jgi:hypothetical protein